MHKTYFVFNQAPNKNEEHLQLGDIVLMNHQILRMYDSH